MIEKDKKICDEERQAVIVRELDKTLDMACSGTFKETMHQIALEIRYLVGAHQSAVSYIPESNFKKAIHTHSFSEKYEKYNVYDVMPTGEGIWSLIVEKCIPMRMTDMELKSHPCWKAFSGYKTNAGLEHPEMFGWLAVPVKRQNGDFIGVLQLSDKYEDDFTEKDQEDLLRFSRVAGLAFDLYYINSNLLQTMQRAEKAEEELRIIQRAEKAEKELENVNQQLEKKIWELNQKNKELKQSEITAESASKAKSDFLANMSHELRTPLNSVIGFANILLKNKEKNKTEKDILYLKRIERNGKHLLNLINNILDISKIEAERAELHIRSFDIIESLESCLESFQPLLEEKSLFLKIEYDVPYFLIKADETKIYQCMNNLLSNAIKFTDLGGITVKTKHLKNYLEIHVQDSGIGLEPKEILRVFEPFIQPEKILTREHSGTGLGLTISKKFMEMHGGSIKVESQKEKGSTFILVIPLEN